MANELDRLANLLSTAQSATPPGNGTPPPDVGGGNIDIGGALAGLAANVRKAIEDLIKNATGAFKSTFDTVGTGLTGLANGVFNTTSDLASQTGQAITDNITTSYDTLVNYTTMLTNKVKEGIDFSRQSFNDLITGIKTTDEAIGTGIATLRDDFVATTGTLKDDTIRQFTDLQTGVQNSVVGFASDLGAKLQGVTDGIKETVSGTIQGIKEGFQGYWDNFKPWLDSFMADFPSNLWLSLFSVKIDPADIVAQIQALASLGNAISSGLSGGS